MSQIECIRVDALAVAICTLGEAEDLAASSTIHESGWLGSPPGGENLEKLREFWVFITLEGLKHWVLMSEKDGNSSNSNKADGLTRQGWSWAGKSSPAFGSDFSKSEPLTRRCCRLSGEESSLLKQSFNQSLAASLLPQVTLNSSPLSTGRRNTASTTLTFFLKSSLHSTGIQVITEGVQELLVCLCPFLFPHCGGQPWNNWMSLV